MGKEKLKQDLGKVINDAQVVEDLVSIFIETASSPEVKPENVIAETLNIMDEYNDFSKALKKKDMEKVTQILQEYLSTVKSEPPVSGLPPEAEKPPEANKPPDTKPKQEIKAAVPVKTKVYLNKKIISYGGQFYDYESKAWIKGTPSKPQEVLLTLFVQQKIGTGELIEVRE